MSATAQALAACKDLRRLAETGAALGVCGGLFLGAALG